MPRPVIDVAVFTNAGVHRAPLDAFRLYPPLSTEVEISQGVSIGPIERCLGNYVSDLCLPHALKVATTHAYKPLYAFGLTDDADTSGYTWDADQRLQTAIALSRLAHPTSIAFDESARLFLKQRCVGRRPSEIERDDVDEALPGPIHGFGAEAFVADEERNWLTRDDAELTRQLMEAYYASQGGHAPRLTRALWFHEYAARTYELDMRWVLVVIGLEALITVGSKGVRQQFRQRSVALADRCGVAWTDEDACTAYRLRSEMAHGRGIRDTDAEHQSVYCRAEAVLRGALRHALLDLTFAAIFATDAGIRAEWPIGAS